MMDDGVSLLLREFLRAEDSIPYLYSNYTVRAEEKWGHSCNLTNSLKRLLLNPLLEYDMIPYFKDTKPQ